LVTRRGEELATLRPDLVPAELAQEPARAAALLPAPAQRVLRVRMAPVRVRHRPVWDSED